MSSSGRPGGNGTQPPLRKEPVTPEKNHGSPLVSPAITVIPPPVVLLVTQVTHSDIPDICVLYKKVWEEFRGKIPQEFEKMWQPSALEFTSWMEGMTYFIARKEKKLVGILGGTLVNGAARLANVCVDPEFRHQGVGTALVNTVMEWARRSNATSLWVEPLIRFDGAIQLFRRLGFKEIGVFHKHQWKEDVMLLETVF